MVGVAPGARILPITTDRPASHVSGDDAQADGIRYAVKHGAKVISMAGSGINPEGPLKCDYYVQGAVDYAVKHDVVLVAAAGNDGDSTNEPLHPDLVSRCSRGRRRGLSGEAVGEDPATAVRRRRRPGVNAGSIGRAGVFTNNSGTSTATALAAGAIALVRAKFPKMSAREVVQRIIASTLDSGPKGVDLQTGYGVLRPYHALTDKVPANAPNPVFDRWDAEQRGLAARSASPSPRPTPVAAPREKKAGTSSAVTFTVAGILVLFVLAGAALFLIRRNRRPGQPA